MGNTPTSGTGQNVQKVPTVVPASDAKDLASSTPFSEKEIQFLMKRYTNYDQSDNGVNGITLADCLTMTEFMGNKFVQGVLEAHISQNTKKIHPKAFLSVLSLLSSKTSAAVKKEYLFQLVDVYETGVLTHDEIFRIYKLLFGGAVSDDHILDLTFHALRHPDLATPGQINKEEFLRMIPDNEIRARLTVDFLSGITIK